MDREFTPDELATYNGRDGKPVYVALNGKVYDVTASKMWKGGEHIKRHHAGNDLSADIAAAPHQMDVFEREGITVVGTLKEVSPFDHLPAWIADLIERFPMVQRHPHPMVVHFPMAYPVAAALFTILDLLRIFPKIQFDVIAFFMLILGTIFTLPAMATGFFTWWVNYQGKMVHHVSCKIVCSIILLCVHIMLLILRVGGFAASGTGFWAYTILMIWLMPNALLLGYHGGQLTFPHKK